jgi:tetratricopeptide (TPR) repeat protein
MNGRKTVAVASTILTAFLLASCASVGPGGAAFTAYRESMLNGGRHLLDKEYQPALDDFLRANSNDPSRSMPLALAGQAYYNLGDLQKASRCLSQAMAVKNDSYAYLIIKGYQALIAFKQDRHKEGTAALGDYVSAYRVSYPDSTYKDVERLHKLAVATGDVPVAELEPLITHQITRYEIQLFKSF